MGLLWSKLERVEEIANLPWTLPPSTTSLSPTATIPVSPIDNYSTQFTSIQLTLLLQLINDSGVDLRGFKTSIRQETMRKYEACLIWILEREYHRRDLLRKAADLLLQVPSHDGRLQALLVKRVNLHPLLMTCLRRLFAEGQIRLSRIQLNGLVEDLLPLCGREPAAEVLLLTAYFSQHEAMKEILAQQIDSMAGFKWLHEHSLRLAEHPLALPCVLAWLDSGNAMVRSVLRLEQMVKQGILLLVGATAQVLEWTNSAKVHGAGPLSPAHTP